MYTLLSRAYVYYIGVGCQQTLPEKAKTQPTALNSTQTYGMVLR